MNASGEWDINSAQLSLCRVGMTRQSDSSIVFRWKKPVKFARALHRDSVPLIGQNYMTTDRLIERDRLLKRDCLMRVPLYMAIAVN